MYGDGPAQHGLWGARLPVEMEVPGRRDVRCARVPATRCRCSGRADKANQERILIQSDCLGALDAIDAAWRAGGPRGLRALRGRDHGAMLESICRLRAQLAQSSIYVHHKSKS